MTKAGGAGRGPAAKRRPPRGPGGRRGLRSRLHGLRGDLPLLVCLTLLTCLLTAVAAGAPPLLDRLAGRAFGDRLVQAQESAPGVTYSVRVDVLQKKGDDPGAYLAADMAAMSESLENWVAPGLPGELRTDSARIVLPGIGTLTEAGPAELSLLHATDAPRKGGYAAGRAPRANARTVEIAVSSATRDRLGLRLGQRLDLGMGGLSGIHATAQVVGVFAADDDSVLWREEPLLAAPLKSTGRPHQAMVLAEPGSIIRLQEQSGIEITAQWGLRLHLTDEEARKHHGADGRRQIERALVVTSELAPDKYCPLATFGGLVCSLGLNPTGGLDYSSRLPDAIGEFGRQWGQGQAVVAFGLATLLIVALAAAFVTALLALRRRLDVHRLQRARGASALGLAAARAGHTLPGALLGLAAGLALAGRVGEGTATGWGAAVALGCWLPLPLVTFFAVRDGALLRADGAARASSIRGRRVVAELALLLLAVAGVWALRSRGTRAQAGPDPLLAAVPALLGLATVVILVRCYPLPVRLLARWSARRRGAVALIALLRAAKEAPARALALLVLVVTLAGAVFGGLIAGTLTEGREEGTRARVGADASYTGVRSNPQAAQELARARGVEHSAQVGELRISARDSARGSAYGTTSLLGVESEALLEVGGESAAARAAAALPDAGGAVPVLAHGGPRVGDRLEAEVGGRTLRMKVTGTLPDAVVDDVALGPLRSAESPELLLFTDLRALRSIEREDFGQLVLLLYGDGIRAEELRAMVPRAAPETNPGELFVLEEELARLSDDGLVGALTLAHTVATGLAVALALLALVLELLLSAPARGRTAARLRTMGLGDRQTAALHLVQLLPLVVAAVVGGTALGLALPSLLGPALDLGEFTGTPGDPGMHADVLLTVALGAGCAGLVAGAVAVETWLGRRRGLGQVLRVGRVDD
ncbi:hypothetical protein H9Y04_11790 [Streptomyces sp. TRM66268-LWL]|uniref:ABC transporter permease n=1 Tax=Streptomyces polyasparticus TaxID=2767826 RepID=A0ABR7SCN7_9ACTN|nr:FtsX-like permease family protein [Streptomyces polyasparticus]MBC9713250.1 hypothetical protein [Streptomyces polyasparticus]